jgi:hypothetical protein
MAAVHLARSFSPEPYTWEKSNEKQLHAHLSCAGPLSTQRLQPWAKYKQ